MHILLTVKNKTDESLYHGQALNKRNSAKEEKRSLKKRGYEKEFTDKR